jgi:iron-sulfur cluster assembly protein
MLTLTPSAQRAVRRFMKGANAPVAGLRISVTGGDHSGMQYGMNLEAQARLDDLILECGEVQVFLDPSIAALLAGATVDFHDSMDGSGFRFVNPNTTARGGSVRSLNA